MKILIFIHHHYGRRIAENIQARSPSGWLIHGLTLSQTLPLIGDEPEEFLPNKLPASDLVLQLINHDF